MRMFIAAELPDAHRHALGEIQARLKARGFQLKPVAPRTIHLTLRFLGESDPARIEGLCKALGTAAENAWPPTLRLDRLGTFPPRGPARVLWIGLVGETEALSRLAESVEHAVGECGWGPEKRRFQPHVTIARIDPSRSTGLGPVLEDPSLLKDIPEGAASEFPVERFILFESRLDPAGAVHVPLRSFLLRGRPPSR